MIELGAFWAFYSMSLLQVRPKATCYMIEPDEECLNIGKKHFEINNFSGTFIHDYIAKDRIVIDKFVKDRNIDFIDILHSDIQEAEVEMLRGAEETLRDKKVGYVFIGTHTQDIHYHCLDTLKRHNYQIICAQDLEQTYCHDGIIVAQHPDYEIINFKTVNRNES